MKAWDEKLEDFVDLDELESEITKPKKQPTYRNAFYKPVEDGFITPEQKAKQEQPHNKPVAEKSAPIAAYEYNIEIACAQEDLVTYQIGAFSLGKTDNEPLISSWKKSASQAGFTLLTASIMVNEPKTLYREFFSLSGQALSFKEVTPVKKGVGTHTESFIPIKTAVQVGEQLGWPTVGFYYHFVDDKLAHEYQIVGNDASTFFVTQSSVDQLSSSLLSDHQYNFILLPWKINNSPVTRQHLLYLPQKMTQQEFAELNATWLDENACLLDVETIVKSKNESVLVREKIDTDSVTYVIQSGDSLWKIAHQQGTTIEKLVELNPQYKGKEGQIKVGDTLVIELKKNESTAASAHVVVLNGDGNRETWDEIAKQHCMAPKELLKLNPMFENNPSALKVGDELCVNDSQQAQDKEERITLPPIVLTHIGQVSSFVNSFSTMSKRLLNAFVVAALSDKNIPANTPIVNVGKKTLRSTELSSSNDLELLANGKGQLIKKKADGESVKAIQKALLKLNFDLGSAGADGKFGSGTESVIKTFQSTYTPTNKIHADYKIGSADGIVGKNTLLALDEAVVGKWQMLKQPHPIVDSNILKFLYKNVSVGLTDEDYEVAAKDLGCEIAAIKAVALTETGSSGSFYDFHEDLVPSILFERHYFSRLTNGAYDDKYPDISNKIGGGYGKFSAQYGKLTKAYSLDSSAALKSASWGRFQIMGANHKLCNYETVEEFVYDLSLSENNHLRCFVEFIKSNNQLHKAIKEKDWLTFALKYNGPKQQGYDVKMRENYEKISN